MESVRIGIIGYGNIGSAHARCIASGGIKNLELVAICDIDKNKLAQAGKSAPEVALFTSYEELIGSGLVDAVLIAVPHYLHSPIAIASLEKDLHVLTEKPAGVYTKQVEQMNEAARQSGKVFGIMFNQRTHSLFQKARELVRSGQLGKTKRLVWVITNWYRTQAYYDSGGWRATWAGEGGGVLINQAPHNLDLWQWIFGMPIRLRASCYTGKYHNIEVEDEAAIYAEYENGATATFLTSTGEFPGTNRLEITGDHGKIVVEDGKLRFWELEESEREFCFTDTTGFSEPKYTYQEFLPQQAETAHAGILQNFTNAILHGEELIAPGYDGIHELTLSNAAYLSAWTDDWVHLPVDGDLFFNELQKRAGDLIQKDVKPDSDFPRGQYSTRWNIRW
ncbi:MAG: Gfo/Idh/MocA family oxidoreductase [Oscillospiraceae bacterium]|nr:Gfo/Idh/MocA family oxidoreductase [Oscillospiraceae bacterium]MDD4414528.1 Gfo/Idh/MocA family oxidoreductase [Oscillospiraceae bacterium]